MDAAAASYFTYSQQDPTVISRFFRNAPLRCGIRRNGDGDDGDAFFLMPSPPRNPSFAQA
jgi:hypothetical protein